MTAGNPYGCPAPLFEIIEAGEWFERGDMLTAIKKLGPERVQYIGCERRVHVGRAKQSTEGLPTAWALDGRRATVGEICRAAGIKPPAKERGQMKEMADA